MLCFGKFGLFFLHKWQLEKHRDVINVVCYTLSLPRQVKMSSVEKGSLMHDRNESRKPEFGVFMSFCCCFGLCNTLGILPFTFIPLKRNLSCLHQERPVSSDYYHHQPHRRHKSARQTAVMPIYTSSRYTWSFWPPDECKCIIHSNFSSVSVSTVSWEKYPSAVWCWAGSV